MQWWLILLANDRLQSLRCQRAVFRQELYHRIHSVVVMTYVKYLYVQGMNAQLQWGERGAYEAGGIRGCTRLAELAMQQRDC